MVHRTTTALILFASSWAIATIASISFADSSNQLPLLMLLVTGGVTLSAFYASGMNRRSSSNSRGSGENPSIDYARTPTHHFRKHEERHSKNVVSYPIELLDQQLLPFADWRARSVTFDTQEKCEFSKSVVNAYQLYLIAEFAADALDDWTPHQIRDQFLHHLAGEQARVFSTLLAILNESIGQNDEFAGICEEIPLEYLLAVDMLEDYPGSPIASNESNESDDSVDGLSPAGTNFGGLDWRLARCLAHARTGIEDTLDQILQEMTAQEPR